MNETEFAIRSDLGILERDVTGTLEDCETLTVTDAREDPLSNRADTVTAALERLSREYDLALNEIRAAHGDGLITSRVASIRTPVISRGAVDLYYRSLDIELAAKAALDREGIADVLDVFVRKPNILAAVVTRPEACIALAFDADAEHSEHSLESLAETIDRALASAGLTAIANNEELTVVAATREAMLDDLAGARSMALEYHSRLVSEVDRLRRSGVSGVDIAGRIGPSYPHGAVVRYVDALRRRDAVRQALDDSDIGHLFSVFVDRPQFSDGDGGTHVQMTGSLSDDDTVEGICDQLIDVLSGLGLRVDSDPAGRLAYWGAVEVVPE